ncbi:MAG: tRNA pseudouridine(38-40) synthase TruA [Bacteroidales bacterium]
MEQKQQSLVRYFIRLSYDGSTFNGWQRQSGNVPTVQKEIEEALSLLLRQEIIIVGAGRTDTGVHAREYYAHLDVPGALKEFSAHQIAYKLNRMLPPQVAVQGIMPVTAQAHARFSAISRTYHYHITTRKDPFERGRAWLFEPKLDICSMQQAADVLLEHKDFACFSKSNTQVNTTICEVMKARWQKEGHLLVFEIKANRFLRNMVRAIVGTLVEVGLGKTSQQEFAGILASGDRKKAGYSVPGHGLFLTDIEYPGDIWLPERNAGHQGIIGEICP